MLEIATNQIKPKNILFFMIHFDLVEKSQSYLEELSKNFHDIHIHISGNDKLIELLQLPKNITWIKSVQQLEGCLV